MRAGPKSDPDSFEYRVLPLSAFIPLAIGHDDSQLGEHDV